MFVYVYPALIVSFSLTILRSARSAGPHDNTVSFPYAMARITTALLLIAAHASHAGIQHLGVGVPNFVFILPDGAQAVSCPDHRALTLV